MMKTIVVSGITLRKGGTLTILRDALNYLSELAQNGEWRIVALVNRKELCDYPNIEYIEVPLKGWIGRLWYEYVTMYRISKEIEPVYLWLSMHDVTPRVVADRQAVYCQTSFPFYKWKWRDFLFDPKIPIFAMLTRFYYRINVHRNRYLIVQQDWLREGLGGMLGVKREGIIVAPPESKGTVITPRFVQKELFTFLYVSTPDCHKNFETLCKAAQMLEEDLGTDKFRVCISINGTENKYARWIYQNWGNVESIEFHGFMGKTALYGYYQSSDCLVFPSNIETWGLPISEYMEVNGGPMILTDLPYARSTAMGSQCTAFFKQDCAVDLKERMKEAYVGNYQNFHNVEKKNVSEPVADSWNDLFEKLLK